MTACGLALVLTTRWMLPRGEHTTEHEALRSEPRPDTAETSPPAQERAWVPTELNEAPAIPASALSKDGEDPALAAQEAASRARNACECQRSDSVLWRTPPSRLSPVLIEQSTRPHKDHTHLELELGVVNNSNEPMKELTLVVRFYEQEPPPSKKKRHTKDRPLYFEGPLLPGRAIKWHVEARATHFELENPKPEPLVPGGDSTAPADAFAELLDANHRPIRLHGAMMLAFLNDPRAQKGAATLKEALREEEAPYLDRVLQAASEVQTCRVTASEQGSIRVVQACLFNQSAAPRSELAVRVRALSHEFDHRTPVAVPPVIIAEQVERLDGELAANTGRRVEYQVDVQNPDGLIPAAFELFADRYYLLH
jgi:hypothetical protein